MSKEEIFEKVKAIIVDQLGVDDALDLVELSLAIEEEFGGEISDDEAQKITTVGEAVVYLESHM
jgi:acyl carrier protein